MWNKPLSIWFLSVSPGMLSIYTLTALALQRWLLVTHPGKFSVNSPSIARISLVVVWALALAIASPPLAGWAYYAPESSGLRYAS